MNRIVSGLFLSGIVAIALSTNAQAATISVQGDTGGPRAIGSTGQLQVIIDVTPENNTFTNGGLSLTVQNSQPGVIAFTDAEVINRNIFGANIWSFVQANDVSADTVGELVAGSVSTQALNPSLPGNPIDVGGSKFLFATIDYEVVGGGGSSVEVGISQRIDPIISNGQDVSNSLVFVPSEPILGEAIPEPASLALVGLGLAVFGTLRRRV